MLKNLTMYDMHVFSYFMEEYESLMYDKHLFLSDFHEKCIKGPNCKSYKNGHT